MGLRLQGLTAIREPFVLFLTDEGSPTIGHVKVAVEDAGHSVQVVSTRDLPKSDGGASIGLDVAALGRGPTRLDLRECAGVWRWHAETPSAPDTDRQVARYVEGEWKLAVQALASVVDPHRWINHPRDSDWWECNKIAQLRFARDVGLPVPETLLSNDPAAIMEFASRFETVAVKAQAAVRLQTPDGFATTFTQLCTASELSLNAPKLSRAPVLLQPYLDKRVEIRATVIDEDVFLCEIDSQASERTRIDWRRYDFERVGHKLLTDSHLEQQLRRLVAQAGLRYAAIDLLQTPSGDTYFLDLNPSGQFRWIEELTGAPITQTLANSLVSGGRSVPSPR